MLETQPIWAMLAEVKVGTLLAWAAVIIAVITALVKGTTKIFEVFAKYKKLKEDNEKQSKLLKEHDETLDKINESLKSINDALNEQKDVNLKQIRYTIVHTCYDAMAAGEIQIGKLKSLEEMYDEYINVFNGNSYVTGLVKRVRDLPIVGTLDE